MKPRSTAYLPSVYTTAADGPRVSLLTPGALHSTDYQENAVIETRTIVLRGAKRIKKQFDLVNKATKESKLKGEPKWNDT
jgi:hypothetical protein